MTTNTVSIADLRAEHQRIVARRADLGSKRKELAERKSEIGPEIRRAIASADEKAVETLRAERARIDQELPDLEGAEALVAEDERRADRELAKAEVPTILAELRSEIDSLASDATQLARRCQRIRTIKERYQSRFSASLDDGADAVIEAQASDQHPRRASQMPDVARLVFDLLLDYTV